MVCSLACAGNAAVMDEPVSEIGRRRAHRAKWFFTYQVGGLLVVMALLAVVAASNIVNGEDTGWWVALLIAEPVVLVLLIWFVRRAIDDAKD